MTMTEIDKNLSSPIRLLSDVLLIDTFRNSWHLSELRHRSEIHPQFLTFSDSQVDKLSGALMHCIQISAQASFLTPSLAMAQNWRNWKKVGGPSYLGLLAELRCFVLYRRGIKANHDFPTTRRCLSLSTPSWLVFCIVFQCSSTELVVFCPTVGQLVTIAWYVFRFPLCSV